MLIEASCGMLGCKGKTAVVFVGVVRECRAEGGGGRWAVGGGLFGDEKVARASAAPKRTNAARLLRVPA